MPIGAADFPARRDKAARLDTALANNERVAIYEAAVAVLVDLSRDHDGCLNRGVSGLDASVVIEAGAALDDLFATARHRVMIYGPPPKGTRFKTVPEMAPEELANNST